MYAGTKSLTADFTNDATRRPMRHFMLTLMVTSILAGCATRTTQAPVTDITGQAPTAPAPTGGTYVVKPGDTLFKIAQANNMDVGELTRLNNITDPSQLRIGQVLRLDTSTPAPTPSTPTTGVATPIPVTPVTPAEPTQTARASDANIISWAWPTTGKIIQGFNTNTKGIDIEGQEGDPVLAAADGKVMYAGNGVRGLGNLILLGHSDGFITAYAHNQALLVKTGDQVTKGTRIASLGQTDTTSPRLHFEIRRRGTPVNPLAYLPPR